MSPIIYRQENELGRGIREAGQAIYRGARDAHEEERAQARHDVFMARAGREADREEIALRHAAQEEARARQRGVAQAKSYAQRFPEIQGAVGQALQALKGMQDPEERKRFVSEQVGRIVSMGEQLDRRDLADKIAAGLQEGAYSMPQSAEQPREGQAEEPFQQKAQEVLDLLNGSDPLTGEQVTALRTADAELRGDVAREQARIEQKIADLEWGRKKLENFHPSHPSARTIMGLVAKYQRNAISYEDFAAGVIEAETGVPTQRSGQYEAGEAWKESVDWALKQPMIIEYGADGVGRINWQQVHELALGRARLRSNDPSVPLPGQEPPPPAQEKPAAAEPQRGEAQGLTFAKAARYGLLSVPAGRMLLSVFDSDTGAKELAKPGWSDAKKDALVAAAEKGMSARRWVDLLKSMNLEWADVPQEVKDQLLRIHKQHAADRERKATLKEGSENRERLQRLRRERMKPGERLRSRG